MVGEGQLPLLLNGCDGRRAEGPDSDTDTSQHVALFLKWVSSLENFLLWHGQNLQLVALILLALVFFDRKSK